MKEGWNRGRGRGRDGGRGNCASGLGEGRGHGVTGGTNPEGTDRPWGERRGKGTGTGVGTGEGRDGSRLEGVRGNRGEILDSRALPRRTRLFEGCGHAEECIWEPGQSREHPGPGKKIPEGTEDQLRWPNTGIRGRRERKQCARVLRISVLRHEANPSRDLRIRKGRKSISASTNTMRNTTDAAMQKSS